MAIETVGLIGENLLHPEQMRRILRGMAPEGTLKAGDFAVTENGTPNMSVNVAAGEAYVEGDESTSQGLYYVRNDATLNVAVSAASGANPRKDIVVVRVRDDDYSGATNAGDVAVIAGTPAASPTVPATPSNAVKVAEITVGQSASTVVQSNIVSTRYRSRDTDHQYLINTTGSEGVLGALTTIIEGTVTMPEGWVQYDLHIHGRVVWETQSSSGTHNRITTLNQVPSGETKNEGRVSLIGAQTGVSALYQDPIDVVVSGLTANTTYRYQAQATIGGATALRMLAIATLTRLR